MQITVNGKAKKITAAKTLHQFLIDTLKKPKGVVVLLNDNIIKEHQQKEIYLNSMDRIEFIQMIGGG